VIVATQRRPSAESDNSPERPIMPRKLTKPAAKKKAHELLQRLVRMKASDDNGYAECVSCGVVKHYKQMDGGHFISRTYSFHSLREENIHPQCKTCNRFFSKSHDDYRRYMVDMYGEDFVEWLTDTKHTVHQVKLYEYEEIIAELNERIKGQAVRLGEK
jgi:5-methylcytosine-specific restriction endonuclease McrA